MKQKLASPKIHELRAKLKTLAERGINGEKDVAQAKLARLEKRYDFNTPNVRGMVPGLPLSPIHAAGPRGPYRQRPHRENPR